MGYTAFNMAASIAEGTTGVALTYDSEHRRIQQSVTVGGAATTTTYLNDPAAEVMNEMVVAGGVTTWKSYIVADGKIVAQRAVTGSTVTMDYFVPDHLGSVAVITDSTGSPTTAIHQFYDARGKERNASGTPDTTCSLPPASPSTRGYTNQEEMPSICLVNYNARIYDPAIGRFMSADDVIPDAYQGQSYNRYT